MRQGKVGPNAQIVLLFRAPNHLIVPLLHLAISVGVEASFTGIRNRHSSRFDTKLQVFRNKKQIGGEATLRIQGKIQSSIAPSLGNQMFDRLVNPSRCQSLASTAYRPSHALGPVARYAVKHRPVPCGRDLHHMPISTTCPTRPVQHVALLRSDMSPYGSRNNVAVVDLGDSLHVFLFCGSSEQSRR